MDTTRVLDSQGRLTLGKEFANVTMIVTQKHGGVIELTPAEVVPKRELWLHQDKTAKKSMVRALEQAQNREFVEGPDIAADLAAVEDEKE